MEFDVLSKRIASAIEEAEKSAPIGMFGQFLHQLAIALTSPKQWPLVAREAAFTAAEIGRLNFFKWLLQIEPCQEPIRQAFRLANEFLASEPTRVEDYRFIVCRLLYELQGISTHSSAFTALTGFERIAQFSVRISFELAKVGSAKPNNSLEHCKW
jgi:hypothetical protein